MTTTWPNTSIKQHVAANPTPIGNSPKQTWCTTTSVLVFKRGQDLIGEAAFLVTEIRSDDRTYNVPWKVEIRRNAYDDQSWAKVSRWSQSHIGGGTFGRWELVTVENITRLPIAEAKYFEDDFEPKMLQSFEPVLKAGLLTLGLI